MAMWMASLIAVANSPTSLSNNMISATFGDYGLTSLTLLSAASATVAVQSDAWEIALAAGNISSLSLPAPKLVVANTSDVVYEYATPLSLTVTVSYSLASTSAAYVTKTLSLSRSTLSTTLNLTVLTVAPFSSTVLSVGGVSVPTASLVAAGRLGDYVLFSRFGASLGTMLSAQNPYLSFLIDNTTGAATMTYPPGMNLSAAGTFTADGALLGLHLLSGRTLTPPAQPLDAAEQAAMVAAVKDTIVVPQDPSQTVKINIGWTENDYQIDIGTADGRVEYKRIIDRAAQLGMTTLLFAPQNSDVSSRANNTDAWGWEQLLWFGMGQKLRQGEWKPGDALPFSLLEMLSYFRAKGVRPVA
mgnify:CR=1 FL=1